MALSSLGLITGKVASMALGFLFWLLAARLFDASAVGLAAAAVSAMMLCVQLALLGAGSALIAEFPAHRRQPARLLDTTFSLVVLTSVAAAALFLVLAAGALDELGDMLAAPAFVPVFVAVTVLGTAGVVLDQASMALGRGDHVVVRNLSGGVATLGALALLGLVGADTGPVALFALWLAGTAAVSGMGMGQLRASVRPYRYRPALHRRTAARLVRLGLPNYALTLTDRAPGLVIPLLVTELISPDANAYWYTMWMMAWAVYVVPVSVGTALFAEVCHRPGELAVATHRAVRSSLGFGVAAAITLGLGADLALSLLGPAYATVGATPLRVLLVAVVPLTFVQAWFAVCRARRRLGEAVLIGAIGGVTAVVATAAAGAVGGLGAMAAAWSSTQALTGAWCLFRLRTFTTGDAPVVKVPIVAAARP